MQFFIQDLKYVFSVNYPNLGLKSAHPIGLACGGTSTRDWVVTLHMLLRSDESAEPVLGLVPGEPQPAVRAGCAGQLVGVRAGAAAAWQLEATAASPFSVRAGLLHSGGAGQESRENSCKPFILKLN